MITAATPAALNIADEYAALTPLLAEEANVLEIIRKNSFTELVFKADEERDLIFSFIKASVKTQTKSYDAAIATAAEKVLNIINNYKDVSRFGFHEETGKILNLVEDLKETSVLALCTQLGVKAHLTELENANNRFKTLMTDRRAEEAQKPLRSAREIIDEIKAPYNAIINKINALVVVNGEADYKDFVSKANALITEYRKVVMMRRSRAADTDEPEETETPEPTK
ncbi:hypothetical protein EOM81_11760 [bacterium]|nr:hypothetical protein [bacterium]